jgi:S1-C subfamily serine protease
MRKLILFTSVFVAGFIAALVLSGRSSSTDVTSAAPTPVQGRGAVLPATPALPDLSSVAERALSVSTNISSTTTYQPRNTLYEMYTGRRAPAQQQTALGSGVIVSADGYVLTNSHVIGDAGSDVVVTLPDDRELPGKVVGIDTLTDLAVVKVDAKGLPTLPWGDSNHLRVAEWVLAVGNPFQFSRTVTQGIVSAAQRAGAQLGEYDDFIQTDAAINPGNSGGALVNSKGELIGINTMIYNGSGANTNVGIGFAIPAALAQEIMLQLIKDGEIRWGSIASPNDMTLVDLSPDNARRLGIDATKGAFVYRIRTASSPYRAGLRPGDLIVSLNGTGVTDSTQFNRALAKTKIGTTASLVVSRDGKSVTLSVPVIQAVSTGGR